MKSLFSIVFILFLSHTSIAQPWLNPLKMAWSSDGQTFNTPTIFQDSSGVPSVIRWKGDTLICAFQWFRQPNPSPSWDRVAVKFSYDNGLTWTSPTPIVVSGMPAGYQRPFDPTLALLSNDSIRIYYSSSATIPMGGLDSTVNTYSAKSTDGIHYTFEPNPRVDVASKPVIDPAVIYFKHGWHYTAPIGSPQQGAYHYVSPNGLNFTAVPSIPSDPLHNWTGNLMLSDTNELRFYGSSQNFIWYNSSANAGVWNGYVNTNLKGGDPSALKVANNNYLIIYVGQPYGTGISSEENKLNIAVYPNPANDVIIVNVSQQAVGLNCTISDMLGRDVMTMKLLEENNNVDIQFLPTGMYFIRIGEYYNSTIKILKK